MFYLYLHMLLFGTKVLKVKLAHLLLKHLHGMDLLNLQ